MSQLTNHTSYIFLTISTHHLVLHLLIWFLILKPDFKLLQTDVDTCLGAQLDKLTTYILDYKLYTRNKLALCEISDKILKLKYIHIL